jgi:hypothetical protein
LGLKWNFQERLNGFQMAKIHVTDLGNHLYLYEVTVEAHSKTVHQVTVRPEYAANLLKPNESTASLVERSFAFLLERESNTSILRSFRFKRN